MKVELFPFQKKAVEDLRIKTSEAIGSYQRTHAPQVVSFTAPTGAGKTIIMSALIENILYGDDRFPEQPDAVIVWLSDSPQLNEQSKQKIDGKADKIRLSQCVTVSEESFDQEMKPIVACRGGKPAKQPRSCRSSSRAVVRTAFRPCPWL